MTSGGESAPEGRSRPPVGAVPWERFLREAVISMHELTYASLLLQEIEKTLAGRSGATVRRVRVRLGEGTGVTPDALEAAFDWLKEKTRAASAHLEITLVPLWIRCTLCDTVYRSREILGPCPRCDALGGLCLSGTECELSDLETDDVPRLVSR
jgi:hydrogenase nickel incorporation protein HypA/HybF